MQKDMQKDIQKDIQKTLADRNIKLTTNQLQILIAIRENTSITRDELIQKCDLAEGTVKSCITALKKKGVLIRKDGKKTGKWVVKI